jgi:hypothetical protein
MLIDSSQAKPKARAGRQLAQRKILILALADLLEVPGSIPLVRLQYIMHHMRPIIYSCIPFERQRGAGFGHEFGRVRLVRLARGRGEQGRLGRDADYFFQVYLNAHRVVRAWLEVLYSKDTREEM